MSWAELARKNRPDVAPECEPQRVLAPIDPEDEVAAEEEVPAEAPAKEEDKAQPAADAENHPLRKTLVLDTGGLIKGAAGLAKQADVFVTIKDVLAEARDLKTKEFIEAFPFEIEIREPTKESMREVVRVAKMTGDFGALSAVDLRVIGLAHTVAQEHNSLDAAATAGQPTSTTSGSTVTLQKKPVVHYVGEKTKGGAKDEKETKDSARVTALPGWGSWDESATGGGEEGEEEEEEAEEPEEDDDVMKCEYGAEQEVPAEAGEEEAKEAAGGWITKENIKEYNANMHSRFNDEDETRTAGCMSTDFALQNVLLHLGVLVVSVEGYRVRHLKKWVLRCHGCYTVVKDTTRQFCPGCGSGDTLKRVSYSVNDKGEEEIWINARRKISVRGTVYNIPKPRGGRQGTNRTYALREDQLQNCGKKDRVNQKKEDLIASLLSDDWMFASESRDKKSSNHNRPTKSSYQNRNMNQGRKRKL